MNEDDILYQDADCREKFYKFIQDRHMKILAIAKDIDVSKSQLHGILRSERPITEEIRKKLNEYLNTNY